MLTLANNGAVTLGGGGSSISVASGDTLSLATTSGGITIGGNVSAGSISSGNIILNSAGAISETSWYFNC